MKRILIVEDNDDMRLLYRRLFRREEDIELAQTPTAEEALELIPSFAPHLYIVDISLPGMSGLELTKIVRKRYPDAIILVVTGHEVSRYYDEAIRLGANDLVSKEIGTGLVGKCREMLSIE